MSSSDEFHAKVRLAETLLGNLRRGLVEMAAEQQVIQKRLGELGDEIEKVQRFTPGVVPRQWRAIATHPAPSRFQ